MDSWARAHGCSSSSAFALSNQHDYDRPVMKCFSTGLRAWNRVGGSVIRRRTYDAMGIQTVVMKYITDLSTLLSSFFKLFCIENTRREEAVAHLSLVGSVMAFEVLDITSACYPTLTLVLAKVHKDSKQPNNLHNTFVVFRVIFEIVSTCFRDLVQLRSQFLYHTILCSVPPLLKKKKTTCHDLNRGIQ